jgi:hypothetical protein
VAAVQYTFTHKQYTEYRVWNIHNNKKKKKLGKCGPCPVFESYTLAFALQLRKKQGKASVGPRYPGSSSPVHINTQTIHRVTQSEYAERNTAIRITQIITIQIHNVTVRIHNISYLKVPVRSVKCPQISVHPKHSHPVSLPQFQFTIPT